MKQFFLSALGIFIVMTGLYAQDSTTVSQGQGDRMNKSNAKKDRINYRLRMEEEGDLVFNKHNIFGIKLATDGYGIFFEKGKFKTVNKTLIYDFELNEKKDPHEDKISLDDGLSSTSSLVPYKINNFYEFKVSVGQERLIGGKGNKNGVSVTALYAGGLSLAILKPYFIEISDPGFRETYVTTFPDWVKNDTLGQLGVVQSQGFFYGWDDLTYKPGINAKGALRFDYGRLNQTVSAIEVGLTTEFYFSKIPQMVYVPYKQFFFNAYVAILFGSRK